MTKTKSILLVRIFCIVCGVVLISVSIVTGMVSHNLNLFYSLIVIPFALMVAAAIGEVFVRLIFHFFTK